MDNISIRHMVILALIQIGVIVSAVLGAGVVHKYVIELRFGSVPWLSGMLTEYGWFLLAVPVAWITFTVRAFRENTKAKTIAVYVGLLLLLVLLIVCVVGGLNPWLRILASGDSF